MSIPLEVQERVFNAVRRACAAWNTWPGHDCVLHAAAASAVLGRLGVQHSVTVGAAAFCFGHGPGDIVNHYTLPDYGWRIKGGFHAWISAGSGKDATLIDLTAYTLPDKACELAAMDGLPTSIAPDLPRWFWGRRRDLLYPDPDMDQSSPGQIWVSPADRNLILPEDAFDRCSGGGTGASA